MCIMMTKHEPSSTRLINIPVTFMDQKYKLLIYTNDIAVNANDIAVTSGHHGALMVVPIPKSEGVGQHGVGLVDVNTDKMKMFRKELFKACELLKPERPATRSYGGDGILYLSNSVPKRVNEVGNYKISVANSFEELMENIDWDQFDKPDDFEDRMNVMKNKEVYPQFDDVGYYYVVAQAQKNVKNDGFGVVYPDCGYDYFPTAHEKMGEVDYDVKMYNMFDSSRRFVMFDGMYLHNHNLNDIFAVGEILKDLETKMIMAETGEDANFEYYCDTVNRRCNFFEMKERHNNGNLVFERKKDIDDSLVQPRYYREKVELDEDEKVNVTSITYNPHLRSGGMYSYDGFPLEFSS